MFHSSSSRHEQYLIRSSPSKATLHKKRASLESEISGADSGYTSSSSTLPSGSPTSNSEHRVTNKKQKDDYDNISTVTSSTTNQTITTNNSEIPSVTGLATTTTTKKKKLKKNQPPRQPDLVYSCPRPLAFPFHNDDHFLPIAEADPRDVARVSPSSLNRSCSLQSSKASVGSTRMYDSGSYQYTNNSSGASSRRALDAESSYSHQSSILSTIQRGTVRSIRSLFQLPDSLSNTKDSNLSRVQTNNTSHTTYSSNTRHTNDSSSTYQPQPRLEIKKGTVQSIKDMFSRKRTSLGRVAQSITPTPPQKGYVGTTIGQFESSSSSYSRANINAAATSKNNKKQAPLTFKPIAVNVTKSDSRKSFTSRATQFASKTFWRSSSSAPKAPSSSTTPNTTSAASLHSTTSSSSSPATKPLPKTPSSTPPAQQQQPKSTIKSEVKKFSARVFTFGRSSSADTNNVSPTSRTTTNEATAATAQPKAAKKSIFSSFKRSDISASVSNNNNKKNPTTETTTNDMVPPATATTTVGKMWKSFKNLVTGKKSSRVGVL